MNIVCSTEIHFLLHEGEEEEEDGEEAQYN